MTVVPGGHPVDMTDADDLLALRSDDASALLFVALRGDF
jgi:hypothetical protein